MTKAEFRKLFLAKRHALTPEESTVRSERITTNFFNFIDLPLGAVIHIFLPILKNNEPDTWLIINRIQRDFPSVKISIPRVLPSSNEMESFFLNEVTSLETNRWGIPEPVNGEITPVDTINHVLIPLLAFDRKGHRVGYGKGFYDTFLARCSRHTKRIGLSMFEGVEFIDDVNEYDQPLHHCITPERVYSF